MDFLFAKLIWFVLFAFILGIVVGWLTCSRPEED